MSIYRLMDKNQKSFVSFKKFTSFICEKGYKKVKKPKTKFTMLQIPSPFFSFTFFSGGGGHLKILKYLFSWSFVDCLGIWG